MLKYIAVIVLLALLISSSAVAVAPRASKEPSTPKVEDPCLTNIEVFEDTPSKAYTVLAPLRSKSGDSIFTKKSPAKLLSKIKADACKLGADAIIKLSCQEAVSGSGFFHSDTNGGHGNSQITSVPVCTATAVKWRS